MQMSFGSGALWAERTDVTGSGIGPRQFGILQDVQINFDFTEKKLYGQFQFAQVVARAQAEITGTAKFAQILGLLYSDIFFGASTLNQQLTVSQLEATTVPALAPFTVLVAHSNSFSYDLGVTYATTGIRLNRVTAPTAPGQYSVNQANGAYTFSSIDAGAPVVISYAYTVIGSGNQIVLTNQLMGTTPTFKATFFSSFRGNGTTLSLNACTASKLSLPTRVDDWTIQNLEFTAFADTSGAIGSLSTVE